MSRQHATGMLMLSVAGVLFAIAAAMAYGPAIGIAVAACAVALLGVLAYNTPLG